MKRHQTHKMSTVVKAWPGVEDYKCPLLDDVVVRAYNPSNSRG
jgi:hypothetical protein